MLNTKSFKTWLKTKNKEMKEDEKWKKEKATAVPLVQETFSRLVSAVAHTVNDMAQTTLAVHCEENSDDRVKKMCDKIEKEVENNAEVLSNIKEKNHDVRRFVVGRVREMLEVEKEQERKTGKSVLQLAPRIQDRVENGMDTSELGAMLENLFI